MSIRYKLIIMFLAIASIPLLFVSVLTYHNYNNSIEASQLLNLQNIAAFKADKIETYFAGLKADMEITQNSYVVRKYLPVLIRFAGDQANPEFAAAQKTLDEVLKKTTPIFGLSDIMLVNPQGKVVYATKSGHYSKDLFASPSDIEQKAFTQGRDRIYFSDVYFDKAEDNRFEILVTAPASDFNGVPVGVIAFEVDMTSIYKLIQDTTGLGNTGEALIGKKFGNKVVFLNPLRHDPNAALTRTINMGDKTGVGLQNAVQGTGAGEYIDYRGKKVVGAWRYIPSLDWGIVAKIDTKEAFADVTNLRNLMAIILVMIIVLSGVMAFSIAHSISEPIKQLSEGAEIIGRGNLDYKIGTNLKDEIGQLSRTFDKMTLNLKQTTASRDELSIEVRERKEAEETLRKSREDLNRAQAVAHSGSWRLDVQRNELTWSEEGYRIFGVPTGTPMTYEGFLDCVHPEDRKTVNMKWKEALRGKGYDIEYRIVADGQTKWVRAKAELESDKDGTPLGGFGTVTDITGRKEMEEALREAKYALEDKVKERTAELAETVSALQEEVQERTKAQEQLRSTSLYARGLLEASLDPLVTISADGKITDVNEATTKVTGVSREKLIGTDFSKYFTEPDKAREGYHKVFAEGFVTDYPLTIKHCQGHMTDVLYNAAVYKNEAGEIQGVFAAARDVTVQKQASQYARSLIEASLDPLVTISADGKITDVNEATIKVTGVSRDKLIGTDFSNYFTEPSKAKEGYQQVFAEGFVTDYPLTIRHSNGRLTDVVYNAAVYEDTHGNVAGVFAAARDVTERKRVENRQNAIKSLLELFATETSRKAYFDSAVKAVRDWSRCEFAGIRIRDDEGNIPYESHIGFDDDFLALENALHLDRDKCLCIRTILEKPQKQERQFVTAGGSFYCNDSEAFFKGLTKVEQKEYRGNCIKWGFKSISVIPIRYRDKVVGAIHLADFQKDKVILPKVQFIETTIAPLIGEAAQRFNVEAELEEYRQHLEDEVKLRTEELARSNRDLEQFAYVASHDLQEPLRAVAGFVGLLRMQLRDSLDAKKLEYMNFATDGVARMQSLISGLLEYSRVGSREKEPEITDSKAAVGRAIAHLGGGVREFGAKITIADDMPKVRVEPTQLAQLFQNLVGNAIKFCDKEAPQVHISAVREDNMWRFAVADNGIGIEPQYAERIFQIFQRLHSRDKYPGTGIGLAICKKIVERHGGKIWVESKPGAGSTFYFTIPDKGDIE